MSLRLFAIALLVSSCADSDVGAPCPMQMPEVEPGHETSTEFPAVVEVNALFPCDALVCVSMSGREPYCSKQCSSDATCPKAFECRTVSAAGPFADRAYCVWRRCRTQLECGDAEQFDCVEGFYGPEEPPGLCAPVE